MAHPIAAGRGWVRRAARRVVAEAGGPARFRVIAVLAAVLALDGADKGTISATADNLKHAFGIHNTGIGLLLTVPALVGAIFTVPFGVLADRVRRARLLSLCVLTWAVAMFFGGSAQSFLWMLISRVALGAVTAAAGPIVASLSGDFFPARERAKMYGFVLAGELVGTGIGFIVSGDISAVLGWRYAYWWLMLPSGLIALLLWRLPEPARGGQSRLHEGQRTIPDADEVEQRDPEEQRAEEEQALREARDAAVGRLVMKQDIEPRRSLVLREDPTGKSIWWAIRYVLAVRTNVVIIVASALGYFYFAGLRGFALIFAQNHYGVPKAVASSLVLVIGLGGIGGVFAGGRVADRLLERGMTTARVAVPAVVMLALPIALAPALWTSTIWLAVPLLTVGAALLGAANPPQDAARLDIMHPHLWGRSESIRTVLRTLLEAAAPTVFGYTADHWFGGRGHHGDQGLEFTLLLFLIAVVAAGATVLIAMRTYPRDVATATASIEATMGDGAPESYPDEERAESVSSRTRSAPRR